MKKKFYVTTAIDYVNALPHLGTAYEKIGADVLARFKRMMGYDVFFLMGVDEHSQNVARQAEKHNLPPKEYCDDMAAKFENVWHSLDIQYDRFIRTTDSDHIIAVQELFQRIYDNGDIYKGAYTGWYCVSCEHFIPEKELVDGKCPVHKKEPQWLEEQNYFFRLSKYQQVLIDHIEKNPRFIEPEIRRNEILNVLKGGLEDISVSRSTETWGIPVPFDNSSVVYVWFDALINYITGAGFASDNQRFSLQWPADVHVIGKDITRFHAVIWPAMLLAAGVAIPKQVFGHGFVYLGGEKMSKTAGTALDPVSLAEIYGPDPLRYFLMREIPFDRDGDFLMEKYETRYNADLANDWGNLVQRVLSMVKKYRDGLVPAGMLDSSHDIVAEWKLLHDDLIKSIESLYDEMKFSVVLTKIWQMIQLSNRLVEVQAPWSLYKKDNASRELDNTLYALLEMIRVANILLYPVLPTICKKIQHQLNIDTDFAIEEAAQLGILKAGHSLGEIEPVFPKTKDK
ncbi:MAG: methionine--tRNA ligase [Candidatus Auribacter fodinae]|jgi:methionyl-tRNA synthetase|uniref:Methionine--tRNA ligase n=1 Tax=Candidatus Auribacter fodinae TaxID=2093366 RepID=A0A3A4R463_9BACT|nr:MAG: methionine--tRNA ligase [Candidatus Auribacter fodinae]